MEEEGTSERKKENAATKSPTSSDSFDIDRKKHEMGAVLPNLHGTGGIHRAGEKNWCEERKKEKDWITYKLRSHKKVRKKRKWTSQCEAAPYALHLQKASRGGDHGSS